MAQTIRAHSEKGGWKVRIDPPRGGRPNAQRHVHISRRKLGGEYSWNADGTRHDKGRFPPNEKHIKRAKEIASEHLRVSIEILQLIVGFKGGFRLAIEEESRKVGEPFTYRSHIGVDYHVVLLGCGEDLVIVTNANDETDI